MAKRRKNPDNTVLLLLALGGVAAAYLLKPTPARSEVVFGDGGGGTPTGGGTTTGGGTPTGRMPDEEARQLQRNINAIRRATNSGPAITVDGKFGPQTFAALESLRPMFARAADATVDFAKRTGRPVGSEILSNPSMFYNPSATDSADPPVVFDLYGSSQKAVLRTSLYIEFCGYDIVLTPEEVQVLVAFKDSGYPVVTRDNTYFTPYTA